ncbi:MAG: DNA methyltransferase [Caldilineaceae bacterium]|nr:DNA methyltransferase [Caldilineaceae bacterium]MDE0501931.1 DNA methyltransferase [bacterium]
MTVGPNWVNRTLWTGDNLHILRQLNGASVDLIYLDPPFNSNRNYEAPIGSVAAGAAFKDAWTLDDTDVAWHGEIAEASPQLYEIIRAGRAGGGDSMMAYLVMMAVRLIHLRRVLKPTGSIYLHCDPTASHYLKLLMDVLFGRANFRNEIAWCYTGPGNTPRDFKRKHDIILRYVKTSNFYFDLDAVRIAHKRSKPSGGRTSMAAAGRSREEIHERERQLILKGKAPEDWWADIGAGSHIPRSERVGYPTQKPLALLDRIIKASCPPDGIVLDPFCGCATTLVAAERLGRQWVGIDLSPLAVKLVKERLKQEMGMFYDIAAREDVPRRTDMGKLPNYRTHKHHLYGQQEGNCYGCKAHFPYKNLTVDHIVPKVYGGSDHINNLQLLCGWCNSKKGTRSQEEFLAEMAKTG